MSVKYVRKSLYKSRNFVSLNYFNNVLFSHFNVIMKIPVI